MNAVRCISCFALVSLVCALLLTSCAPPPPPTEIPITTSSDEARQLFIQGRDKAENLETAEAAKLFDQAIAKDPDFARAYLARAGAGGATEAVHANRERAKSLIDKVSPGERLLILRSVANASGQTALGKAYLDSLFAMFPKDKRLKYQMGLYYRAYGDYKTAVKYYEEAIALDPNFAAPYNQLGYDNVELGNFEAAEKAFKDYIRLMPGRPNPLDSYAEFLRMRGRYDESIAQYKKVLETDPSFVTSMNGLGDCYLFMGNPDKAREAYQQLIDKGTQMDDQLTGYYAKAIAFVHEAKLPEAMKAFDDCAAFGKRNNESSTVISCLASQGWLLSTFGKGPEALKKYDEAIVLAKAAPLEASTRENTLHWSNFWLAGAYADAKKFDKAKEYLGLFAEAVTRRGNPNEKNALAFEEGHLAMMEGRYDEALAKFADVPSDPTVLSYQALSYFKKGDKNNAKAFAEKVMKWNTNSLDLAIARNKAKTIL
ncbi:MAG: Tetratricopeptide repeat protein [Bacteroidetes bacterium]|nr:Tetratricopeptide repeat protein [Bacteroidota bacterium]